MLGEPIESPICAAGTLLKHDRLPAIVLVTISLASGSAKRLPITWTFPPTVVRIRPNQHVCTPRTTTLPPTVLSWTVAKNGPPTRPVDEQSMLRPPPMIETLPPTCSCSTTTAHAPFPDRLPPM